MTWEMTSLDEIGRGGLFADGDWVESKDQDREGSVRLTQLADVGVGHFRDRSDRWLRHDQAQSLNGTFLAPGDILIARMPDPIGRACLVPATIGDAITAVDVAILRPARDDVLPRFAMWMINSPQAHQDIARLQSGTTRKRVSRKNLATVQIPLPPLDEQRRIVDLIEEHLSHLDAADQSLSKANSSLDEMLDLALTRWLSCQDAPLVTLGSVAGTQLGKMIDSKRASGEATPYLANINVRWGSFDLANVRTVPLTAREKEKFLATSGDLLICEGGEPGRGAVWREREPIAFQKAIHRIRPMDATRYSADFIGLMIREGVKRGRWDHLMTGTTIRHLPQEKLRQLSLPAVSIDEQLALLASTAELDASCSRMAREADTALRRSSALRRAVLAAAFSGRLTGHASDTDAVEEIVGEGRP